MDLSQITSIYFDFDGVIADTESGRFEAYSKILRRYGYDMPSRCTLDEIQGLTGKAVMDKYFPDIDPELRKAIVVERNTDYQAHLDKYCRPFPGVENALKQIKSLGYFFALTTANSTLSAGKLLDHIGVKQYFDAIYGLEYCENQVTKKKDYSLLSSTTGRKASECIVVEDSPVGVEGAKKSGYFTIAFGRIPHHRLTQYADLIVHDYDDLLDFFSIK